jgi:hypothetical protein
MPSGKKHENYEVLNLIGYGLSKFNFDFVKAYGFNTKTAFYNYIVGLGIAKTIGTVKNRQDLFDGMVEGGGRKGWWQKGPVYKHRRDYIDALLGNLNVSEYVEIVKLSMMETLGSTIKDEIMKTVSASPIIRSRFKQMQETGREAEYYFLNNYGSIKAFSNATISDARLFGDGYDFQLTITDKYFLAEIKGLKYASGNIRMTHREYEKAQEYKKDYVLVVVKNLVESPVFLSIFDPIQSMKFEEERIVTEQIFYYSIV